MAGVNELGYVKIGVSDLGAWKAFASQALGLEVVDGETSSTCYLRMDYWHYRILLEQDGSDDIAAAGWRVSDVEDLDVIEANCIANNVYSRRASEQEALDRHVLGLLFLSDPAGIPLEIFYGPRVEFSRPIYPGRRMHGRFLTEDGGFGHMVVRQPNLQGSEFFYKNILGMSGSIGSRTVTDGVMRTAVFMNCNRRQHSLAFVASTRGKLLNHLMTEVSHMEDVGLTLDTLSQLGLPRTSELGQHHNDRALSFYFPTPSGWSWEIGWNVGRPNPQAEYASGDIWGHQRLHARPV